MYNLPITEVPVGLPSVLNTLLPTEPVTVWPVEVTAAPQGLLIRPSYAIYKLDDKPTTFTLRVQVTLPAGESGTLTINRQFTTVATTPLISGVNNVELVDVPFGAPNTDSDISIALRDGTTTSAIFGKPELIFNYPNKTFTQNIGWVKIPDTGYAIVEEGWSPVDPPVPVTFPYMPPNDGLYPKTIKSAVPDATSGLEISAVYVKLSSTGTDVWGESIFADMFSDEFYMYSGEPTYEKFYVMLASYETPATHTFQMYDAGMYNGSLTPDNIWAYIGPYDGSAPPVVPPDPDPVSVVNISDPGAQLLKVGEPYAIQIVGTTDTLEAEPVDMSVAGTLPPGIDPIAAPGTLDLVGTPTTEGQYQATFTATDLWDASASVVVDFTVAPADPPPDPEPEPYTPLEPVPYRDGTNYNIQEDTGSPTFAEHFDQPLWRYIVTPRGPEDIPYITDVSFNTEPLNSFIAFVGVDNYDVMELFWLRKRVLFVAVQISVINPAEVLLRPVTDSGLLFDAIDCRQPGEYTLLVGGGRLLDKIDLRQQAVIIEEPDYLGIRTEYGAENLGNLDIRVQLSVSDDFEWWMPTNRRTPR